MSDLNDLISSVFAGGNLQAISQNLGVSIEETAAGIAVVLPALVGAQQQQQQQQGTRLRIDPRFNLRSEIAVRRQRLIAAVTRDALI
jgi:biopolymer transport protein ExbB/TolQ